MNSVWCVSMRSFPMTLSKISFTEAFRSAHFSGPYTKDYVWETGGKLGRRAKMRLEPRVL
jgi:hypothetical protein